jgi:hypothetical protein
VLWFDWNVWTILAVYWLENGIVGFFNVLKLAAVAGNAKLAVIPFFVIHYGLFWLVHGVFVLTLPLFAGLGSGFDAGPFDPSMPLVPGDGPQLDYAVSGGPNVAVVAIAGVGLFISHGLSYLFNFLGRGEDRRMTAGELMFAPYRRLIVLHVTIVVGGLVISMTGAPVLVLVILVGLKTLMDLGFHVREHRAAAGEGPPGAGPPGQGSPG